MNANVRIEEVTAMGDFLMTSYTRDFDAIKSRFVKMDEAFRDGFIAKLDFVKSLESSLMLTESQKGITASLYEEAGRLNADLNFLSFYFRDASLNAGIISALKHDIHLRNIEGAILKLEGLKQFVTTHLTELVDQGMDSHFVDVLGAYETRLREKNQEQNDVMDRRKQLTSRNQAHYNELMGMIRKVIRNGKLVFKGMVTQDEYTATKILKRMRVVRPKKEVDEEN